MAFIRVQLTKLCYCYFVTAFLSFCGSHCKMWAIWKKVAGCVWPLFMIKKDTYQVTIRFIVDFKGISSLVDSFIFVRTTLCLTTWWQHVLCARIQLFFFLPPLPFLYVVQPRLTLVVEKIDSNANVFITTRDSHLPPQLAFALIYWGKTSITEKVLQISVALFRYSWNICRRSDLTDLTLI